MLHKRGAAYSQDLRERVLAKAAEGTRVGEIAKALHVTSSYVSKVLDRLRTTGERSARPQCCHVPPKLARLYGDIRRQVAERPDTTLAELRAWLLEAHKTSASDGLLTKTLKLLGLTFKKSRCGRRSRTGRTSPRPGLSGARTRLSVLAG
jgi:transposase